MRRVLPDPRCCLVLTVLGAFVGARSARADQFTLRLEPAYAATETRTTDALGVTSWTDATAFQQRYRLTLDRTLTPDLRFAASGLYNWDQGWSRLPGGNSEFDSKKWNMDARLTIQGPIFSGGVRYDRRDELLETRSLGLISATPGLVSESYSANTTWRPEDLPRIDLRAERSFVHDRDQRSTDLVRDEAVVGAQYSPAPRLDLRYTGRYGRAQDRLGGSESSDLSQTGRVAYGRSFLSDRGSFYAGYSLTHRIAETLGGAGAFLTTQQYPTAGYAIVDPLATVPEQVVLSPNPALIDGETTASAGIDLGYGRTLAGDNRYRELGAQFADPTTQVNMVYVWVDRALPPGISSAVSWTAYRSDDNVTWTPLPALAGAQFSVLFNRFEIPLTPTSAQFVKVVARPLLPSITNDERFREVFVTEAQFFVAVPAERARSTSSALSGIFGTSTTFQLSRRGNLAYDGSFTATHASATGAELRKTFSVANGLSASHRLNRVFGVRGRVDRTDSDTTLGHSAQNRLSTTLSADPLPTVGAAFTYAGQLTQSRVGTGYTNAFTLVNRLEPYAGVSLSGNGTLGFGSNEGGQATSARLAGASLTVVPHRKLSLAGSYAYSLTSASGGGLPETETEVQSVEGTVSVQPWPMLFGSAGVTHTWLESRPATLANFSLSLSPFPDGALLLRAAYSDTIDTLSEQRTRIMGPSLRWNIRRATYLEAAFSRQEIRSPIADTTARTLFVNLVVTPIG